LNQLSLHFCVIKTKQTKVKRLLTILSATLIIGTAASAQNASGVASQSAQLGLSNVMEIGFTATNSANGNTVSLSFNTTSDYANGVESAPQELKVRSNKNFNVSVKSSSSNFYYLFLGFWPVQSSLAVSNVLDVMVSGNQTGGNIATPFSGYGDVTATAQNLIANGVAGGNQTFEVKYKATPGFNNYNGVYFTDVIYTATQQ